MARLIFLVLLMVGSTAFAKRGNADKRVVFFCDVKSEKLFVVVEQTELDEGLFVDPGVLLYPAEPKATLKMIKPSDKDERSSKPQLQSVVENGVVEEVIEGEVSHMFHSRYNFNKDLSKGRIFLDIYASAPQDATLSWGDDILRVNCQMPMVYEKSLDEMASTHQWQEPTSIFPQD